MPPQPENGHNQTSDLLLALRDLRELGLRPSGQLSSAKQRFGRRVFLEGAQP